MAGYFIPPGHPIEICGYRYDGGMIYIGQDLVAVDGTFPDPCLLNPHLPVARSMPDIQGNLMGYFPAYDTMKPTSRLAYIHWLSGGRRHTAYDIGYPFLFLFGLERALLVDHVQDENPHLEDAILAEIDALIATYGQNNSFHTYASQLRDLARFAAGRRHAVDFSTRPALEFLIGERIASGEEVRIETIFRFALACERTGPRHINLCYSEMLELARTELSALALAFPKFDYRGFVTPYVKCASGAHLAVRLRGMPDRLPAMEENSPFREGLRKIAKNTIKQVKAYAEAVAFNPKRRGEPDLMMLITPSVERALDPARVRKHIAPWAEDTIPASLSELAKDLPGLFPRKIDITAMRLAESRLEKHGLGFIPSAIAGDLQKADPQTIVRVVQLHNQDAAMKSIDWQLLARLAALSFLVTNGRLTEQDFLRMAGSLAGPAISKLAAIYWWQSKKTLKSSALTSLLKSIDQIHHNATSRLLVAAAVAANLQDDDATRKTLERAYKILGRNKEELWSDLHSTLAGGADIQLHRTGIDQARIARIAAETRAAGEILAGIFSNDDAISVSLDHQGKIQPVTERPATAEEGREAETPADTDPDHIARIYPGLQPAMARLLHDYINRDVLPFADFAEAARERGLMADGVIDAINDWSFDRLEIPLIEQNGNNIHIDWSSIDSMTKAA